MKSFFTIIGGIVALAAWIIYLTLIHAYVISTLWGWFVVPTFHTVTLSLPVAYGLCLLFNMFNYGTTKTKAEEGKVLEFAAGMTIAPLIALGIGYITTLFM